MPPHQRGSQEQMRWLALWGRLGASGDGKATFRALRTRYAEPRRAYHTMAHIRHGLTLLDGMRHLCREPDIVELAWWFHDAVYDPRTSDSEERSADLAARVARSAGLAEARCQRISQLVLVTKSHTPPADDIEAAVLVDVDLAILAVSPERFEQYERQVRREYGWVPEAKFKTGRARFLRAMLDRPTLYFTELFRARHESHARSNLQRSLSKIGHARQALFRRATGI